MYPHSREYQGFCPKKKAKVESLITAEFCVPSGTHKQTEGIVLLPHKFKRHSYPRSGHLDSNDVEVPPSIEHPVLSMRLDGGELTWNFDVSFAYLRSMSENCNFISGSVYFRTKSFGNWEPFEFVKYFDVDNPPLDVPDLKIIQTLFPVELLEDGLVTQTLEMTLKLEYFLIEDRDEQEAVLNKHRTKMNNALIQSSPKSDLRIKVGDDEFFVHMRHIKAFSAVSETLSKYVDGSNWDWTDKMTADSMRGLLRFIYYDEVDTINTPEIAFQLLQFGHLYQAESLYKICIQKLLSFTDEQFTFPDIFEMYLFVRIPDEFLELKKHFCGVLSRNAEKYDTAELNTLAQSYESGVGVAALVEILQYKEPVLPVQAPEPIAEPAQPPEYAVSKGYF